MDSYQDAVDKAQDGAIRNLVGHAREATGAFHEAADERLTVHATGSTCEYIPRDRSAKTDKDPLLSYVERVETVRIKRFGVKSMRGGEKRPSFTIEVNNA